MGIKVTNNGFGTLSAGINSSATTVTVDSGQGARFPTLGSGDFFFATLIDTSNNLEIIKVTARSTDSMTVTRAQDNTSARAFSIGDRIELRPTAALFENAHLDNTPTSTGSFGLPKGTTAQQPTVSATEGHIRYDTDDNVVYFSNGTSWVKISAPTPTISSISGSIINGAATNIVLTGTDFGTANLQVKFTPSGGSTSTVTVTPSSATNSGNVAVPSAIYGQNAGAVISVLVTSSDGVSSTPTNMTVAGFATGGDTILSSGNTRTHIFKGTGTFVAPQNITDVDFLVVAGGGQGGHYFRGGGGGAGGVRSTLGQTGGGGSVESKITLAQGNHTITVGLGGSANTYSNPGANGGNSSIGSQIVSLGGGGGGSYSANNAASGGSGGGQAGVGGAGSRGTGAAGTSGQGSAGGDPSPDNAVQLGGGGGGAGEAGKRGGNSSDLSGECGFGGDGVYSTIISTSDATSQSVGEVDSGYVYFGGGGSGSGYGSGNSNVNNANSGGLGGGAKGYRNDSPYSHGFDGDPNTGGGGSGSSGPPSGGSSGVGAGQGGDGGKGVVIIKYTLS
jgi:hypothetical protein